MGAGDLAGRSFFVTGANSGIGRTMTEGLAARGASIVLAARSEERTRPVLDGIRRQFPSGDVRWLQIDLADLDSVRRAASEYLGSGKPLDVLVNNAGIAGTNALSPQGFDVTYATNHIGPFLLTNLLLPRIRESPQGRIVNVASSAHYTVKQMDWSMLDRRTVPRRSAFPDYAMTKLMNVLHAKELARRLTGTAVTTYAVHPGAVATNIWRSLPRPVQWFIKLFMLSNEQGAVPLLHCATAPELASQTGRYYNRSREVRPSPLAADDNLARELWIRTEAIVGP
ncbi:MAG TPA: SDR family oxidoreductase [Gemmatimonadales bacterium]|nr:SDR family oxidoreductase [Gemmatimonadales bacterium]